MFARVTKRASFAVRGLSSGGSLLDAAPEEVVAKMLANKQHRAFVVYDEALGAAKASHPMFQEVADFLNNDKRDFDKHEAIFFAVGPQTKSLFSGTVHNSTRGPGSGGCRYWQYTNFKSFIQDNLRLSQGMGRKNSLAGLWWGGGKGVLARTADHKITDRQYRDTLFQEYGAFTASLRGCYYTAEDVGLTVDDVAQIYSRNRFTTCIPKAYGGSGNPSGYTALGVVTAMEGTLDFLGKGTLAGKTVGVQGLGNVATFMIEALFEKGVKHVIATDVNEAAIARAKTKFAGKSLDARLVAMGDNSVLFEDVDIVAPCALGGILNPETIPNIKSKIVVGAANNQLLDAINDGNALTKRGITYIPDYLANRMGIVNCANESYGQVNNDPAIYRHFGRDWENSIFNMSKKVLETAAKENITPALAANKIADELMNVPHPIWPNRTRQIIKSLVDDGWHKAN